MVNFLHTACTVYHLTIPLVNPILPRKIPNTANVGCVCLHGGNQILSQMKMHM